MKVSRTPLALLCACVALEVAVVAAEYMYRPAHGPPHLVHGHGPHGPHGPHKHHPYASGKAPGGGPAKHAPPRGPPPPHYHGRPMHRPRKPPPPPLSAASPWKTTAYKATAFKTTKEPFHLHGSDADFGSQAAALSALSASKVAGTQLTSITGGSAGLAPAHASALVRPSLALHAYTNVVSDDRGPIHTIPAPQLSPADRPSHLAESPASYEHPGLQHALQRQAIQSALSQLSAAQAARPTGPTTVAPVLHHTQGYQVSEPSTATQEHANLFAPDPDPSRPAAKLRPTTDPYSLPSEGRGPHFSIDPQLGAVSSQPGYMSAQLSPQDLFHLLNGFPLQGLQGLQPLQQDVHGVHGLQGVQPHIQIMPHGLTGDTLTAEHQHLLLQQQHHHLQQLQQQQQYQHQAAQSLRQLQPADLQQQPQYFDEQSYQKSLYGDHDHEVSEDAPRPSVQRPDPIVQDASPSASTVTLFTAAPPQPTSSTPPRARGDQDGAEDDADDDDEAAADEDYEEGPAKHWASSTTQAQAAVTPAPQPSASLEDVDEDDSLQQQVVIREDANSYAADPSLVTPFRRQPNSVHVVEAKVPEGKPLPYGARIRPKRVAAE